MNLPVAFTRWRSDLPSGGNRYDDELTSSLRALGIEVHEHPVTGSWPFPHQEDRQRFSELLATGISSGKFHWLIDNIVAAAVPDVIRAAVDAGHSISIIMHYFASDERGISPALRTRIATSECAAVAAASTVIATSEWTKREVTRRYARKDVAVAIPGVAPAPIAAGSLSSGSPPSLLWLGRLTPTKDPSTFIKALAELQDLDWRAQLVGPDTVDRELSGSMREQIETAGLSHRIDLTGPAGGSVLESIWSETDLLVHTSYAEAYGMVVSEALGRGIPSIVPTGTGALEAQQGVGGQFPPGSPEGLSNILREWLTTPQMRARWQRDAVTRRATLPTWYAAARVVATAMEQ